MKVLWVEDSAYAEYLDLIGPIRIAGYDLTIASDATQGVHALGNDEYSAIIFDIRLPPGSDHGWKKIYEMNGGDAATAKLGLQIVRGLFGRLDAAILENFRPYIKKPKWIRPEICCIYSVDADELIRMEVELYGITHCHTKMGGAHRRYILDIIDLITGSKDSWEEEEDGT